MIAKVYVGLFRLSGEKTFAHNLLKIPTDIVDEKWETLGKEITYS
jgi:hypothetical protein